jgi:hypothetical protein
LRCASLLLREEADLVDRGWRELVDGEEMKLRVGVLQGLELGFLGAAATAIDCHIDSPSTLLLLKKCNFFLIHCVHFCMRSQASQFNVQASQSF